jgi:hypothetical protein
MGHVVRDVSYRAREDGRPNRLGWILVIAGFNLVLWSGLIALIARAG